MILPRYYTPQTSADATRYLAELCDLERGSSPGHRSGCEDAKGIEHVSALVDIERIRDLRTPGQWDSQVPAALRAKEPAP